MQTLQLSISFTANLRLATKDKNIGNQEYQLTYLEQQSKASVLSSHIRCYSYNFYSCKALPILWSSWKGVDDPETANQVWTEERSDELTSFDYYW